ncbi:hypothetical protein GQ53DRAFT_862021 [Thozetella sp. PMI_491]|nr:hypothetical protein GQ53DRAFT_862021 [Thozetella sp. PMI_491]
MELESTGRPAPEPENAASYPEGGRSPKRQRLFVARQACENCRLKKTRCDENYPCSLCRSAGIECRFTERKATKNEVSLRMIFDSLQRLESKLEASRVQPVAGVPSASTRPSEVLKLAGTSPESVDYCRIESLLLSYYETPMASDISASQPCYTDVSYDTHRFFSWPAIKAKLHEFPKLRRPIYAQVYATRLEQSRPPLPPCTPGKDNRPSGDCLGRLNITVINALTNDYFATWNLGNPILDREVFSQHTLGLAVNTNFGYNIESCLLLVVLALGCLGRKALKDGGYPSASDDPSVDAYLDDAEKGPPGGLLLGQMFFDEARKRMGFLLCDHSTQSCQYYLLAGLYFGQALRPADWWAMNSRASACCTAFWERFEWIRDMQSRLFWITVMFEAVLTQELDLPPSNILEYEDRVPLPKFIKFPGITSSAAFSASEASQDDEDPSFFHYHFLSQIAHRRILTRVRDSMFSSRRPRAAEPDAEQDSGSVVLSETTRVGDYPPQALEDELLHQVEQWRVRLPEPLQFKDEEIAVFGSTIQDFLVVPWLRARYLIAKYHLRRPLLHRALHHAGSLTPSDIQKCRDTLTCVMDWALVIKVTLMLSSCSHLRFFSCTQLFGQFLIMYSLKNAPEPVLREMLPANYETWCGFVIEELQKCAPYDPVIARDAEIAATLMEKSVWE